MPDTGCRVLNVSKRLLRPNVKRAQAKRERFCCQYPTRISHGDGVLTAKPKSVLPESIAIGEEGVALAMAKFLRHQIVPCVPRPDIGFYLVSAYQHVLKRVQVKSTARQPETAGTFKFSLSKNKASSGRNGGEKFKQRRVYHAADVDVFIFVHVRLKKFFVVPATELDFRKHWVTFKANSRWANAWQVLQEP